MQHTTEKSEGQYSGIIENFENLDLSTIKLNDWSIIY